MIQLDSGLVNRYCRGEGLKECANSKRGHKSMDGWGVSPASLRLLNAETCPSPDVVQIASISEWH